MSKVQEEVFKKPENPDISKMSLNEESTNSTQNNNDVKVILFCVPGKTFKSSFLLSWSDIILQCLTRNYRPILCQEYDKNLYICKNKCLGANLLSDDVDQKPFQEKVNYDYLVWLDPNVTVSFKELEKLLESPHDVTSGLYLFNEQTTNCVVKFDYDFYKKNGTFNFLTYDNLVNVEKEDNRYFKAEFADMGIMVFKKGVSEKIKYPWFEPNTEEPVGLFTDSYSYCKKLNKAGIDIMVDSNTKMRYFD